MSGEQESATAVVEPEVMTRSRPEYQTGSQTRRMPPYNVVILNDEAHHCYQGRQDNPEADAATDKSLTGDEKTIHKLLQEQFKQAVERKAGPDVKPGDAGNPRARTVVFAVGSSIGCSSWSSDPGSIRRIASSRSITPSSTSETAIFSAAWAVRLPVRVCSIHNLPR